MINISISIFILLFILCCHAITTALMRVFHGRHWNLFFNRTKNAKERKRYETLLGAFNELLADFTSRTGKHSSATSVRELMQWTYDQTTSKPTEEEG